MSCAPEVMKGDQEKSLDFLSLDERVTAPEIARLRQELDFVKQANPFRMVEMALEIQVEKLRVGEITRARDIALHRLAEAYVSIRQKNDLIAQLQRDREDQGLPALEPQNGVSDVDVLKAHISALEKMIEDLQCTNEQQLATLKLSDPPPCYEVAFKTSTADVAVQTGPERRASCLSIATTAACALQIAEGRMKYDPPHSDDPAVLLEARNAVLSNIPLPSDPPDDPLRAIVIPSPFTLHEFLSGVPATLRTTLANYRVLTSAMTYWCPDREEHGYVYTPVYKCSTNPRVATAHRWNVVDVIGRMAKPTECFFNKDGVWYYAGSYRAFKMDELNLKEWSQLPIETTNAIIKDTLSGRKNCSPQNTYETSQLYAAGALKVACVGLQCVGFNQAVYESIMEHSVKFNQAKWKTLSSNSNPSTLAAEGSTPTPPKPSQSPSGAGLRPASGPPRSPSVIGTPLLSVGLSPGSSVWNPCTPGTPWSGISRKKTPEATDAAGSSEAVAKP